MADKKVLLVEDEESIRKALRSRLEERGMQVVEALDGQQALVLITEEKPDLILLDVIMPKMHGIDMLKQLQATEEGRKYPVIILTNYADDPKVIEAVKSGAAELMDKTKCKLDEVIAKASEKLGL